MTAWNLISELVDLLSSLTFADLTALYLAVDSSNFSKSALLWRYLLITSARKEIENWLFPKKCCILSSAVLRGCEKMQKGKGGRQAPCVCIRSWWVVSTSCTVGFHEWHRTESECLLGRGYD